MTTAPPQHSIAPEPLARRLGVTALWLLVINGMIGAGIFGVPAEAERLAGPFSPWVFALCALAIAPVMLCFAQLASAVSATGGPARYAHIAFGPFAGFQIGWAFYIARLTAAAANLNLLVTSIESLWTTAAPPALRIALLLAISGGMVWVNIAGARAAMRSLGTLTLLKLLPLIGLAAVGLFSLDATVLGSISSPPARSDLGAAVLLAIYAYVGFESGLVPAGEAKDPERDMPRALLLGLVVATAIYVLIQIASQRIVPELATSARPLVDAGQALLGAPGAILVVLAIIASVGGNLVGSVFSTPRVTYRLALDGQLPPAFAHVHPKHQTPWISVIVYCVAMFLLAATGSFVWLAVVSVFTRLLIYMTCIAAMPRVRRSADPVGQLKLPGGPAIPLLAGLACVGLLTQVGTKSVLATAGLLAVGTLLFWIAAIRRRQISRSNAQE